MATEVQRLINQWAFRERVLRSYRHQCAFCALQHVELLDAAHIIPDSELHGEPIVSNGMSLCRLHHAAFDRLILGVRPDYIIRVRADVLEEEDGPMLRHGLQGLQGQRIVVPGDGVLLAVVRILDRAWVDDLGQCARQCHHDSCAALSV